MLIALASAVVVLILFQHETILFHCAQTFTEPKTRSLMLDIVKQFETPTVIDAGAWLGDTALQLAKANKCATVYAVEPSSQNCDFILKHGMKNVHVINKCLSSNRSHKCRTDHLDIFSNKTYEMGSVGKSATTIDDIWLSANNGVQLVHLDVEGHEYECLKGARQCLRNNQTIFVVEILNDTAEKERILELFRSHGYSSFIIPENVGWWFRKKGYNYLFLPKMHCSV